MSGDGHSGSSLSIDLGGTFTDIVFTDRSGAVTVGKALTNRERAAAGIVEALEVIASRRGIGVEALLADVDWLLYGTTRATNAVVEGKAARTALFVTAGFPDVLALREGGKLEPFNLSMDYPGPYVPRHLTWEIDERVGAEGQVLRRLDEGSVERAIAEVGETGAEAIAVCLLWSILNDEHERRIGELIADQAPGLPFTLSSELNPILREYRRASSAAIDASLKPLMQEHLATLESDLRQYGFGGTLLVATSFGGSWPVDAAIAKPIFTVGSGPSLAPTAAVSHGTLESIGARDLIVCDTGGTTFDVALVAEGVVSRSNEVWLGERFTGPLLGVKSVDIKSFGAGGGSVAWVDDAGLLHVGPGSAGSEPGPACYGRGGSLPTVTDAAVVLGYFDPARFLGGRMKLDEAAARDAIEREVGAPLGLDVDAAAGGIFAVAAEAMITAIKEMTIDQGSDPRRATIVAGGGAAGMNILAIAADLGCEEVLIPKTAGALSAYGGSVADIIVERRATLFGRSDDLDIERVNDLLAGLETELDATRAGLDFEIDSAALEFIAEARYPQQAWEIEVPLTVSRLSGENDVASLVERFHEVHERLFAVRHDGSPIECVAWVARLTLMPRRARPQAAESALEGIATPRETRQAHFASLGRVPTPCFDGATLAVGQRLEAPAIVEEPTTTIVVHPGSNLEVTNHGYVGRTPARGEATR